MTPLPSHNITSERATDLLYEGQPIQDVYVDGKVILELSETWEKEIVFENCIIEYFSGSVTQFNRPVKLKNCHFKNCQFVFTYFCGGLHIENCTFEKYLDFQAGGHNKSGYPVIINNNEFKDFVNFFDCWFENEVSIENNKFHKGTNLLGQEHNIPVRFDIEPNINDNIGPLNLDNEGE